MTLPTVGWFIETVSASSFLDNQIALGPISIDTRTIKAGDSFWALKAGRDGHEFVETAFAKGAKLAVVEKTWFEKQISSSYADKCIVVEDTLKALQYSAKKWRELFRCPVIGITGTNGKTSTKDIIIKLLSLKYQTHGTEGNLNNYIGLPLTILSIPFSAEIVVLEMGASYADEINELCEIAMPTHGLVTSIAKAHLEGFGSLEIIAETKGQMYDAVAKNGIAFVPTEYSLCVEQTNLCRQKIGYSFASKPSNWETDFFQGTELSFDEIGQASFMFEGARIKLINPGKASAQSALAGLTVAKTFQISTEDCEKEIANWKGVHGRTQIYSLQNTTIIDDSYNANPASMRSSLELLKMMKVQRRIAILGDMNELGGESASEHQSLGEELINYNLNVAIFVGKEMQKAYDIAKSKIKSHYFPISQELETVLSDYISKNDTILVKASRSIQLERIVKRLLELFS